MPDFVPGDVVEKIASRASVLHPGVEADFLTDSDRSRPYTILWNHRWEWDKNPEEFFEAVCSLGDRGLDFRLAVAGQTSARSPDAFADVRRRLAERIVHWGFIESPAEYRRLLARSDVVASTARHEFFGMAVLEAVAAGCAPVLPRRLSYPELLGGGDDDACFFYENGEFTQRLAEVMNGPLPSRARIASAAEPFLWPKAIRRWDEAFAVAAARA